KRLRIVNNFLLGFIILLNGYVLVKPLLPKVDYEIKQRVTKPVKPVDRSKPNIDTSTNHLVIPALQLDEPVLDSTNPSTVHQGIWRRPNTSTPDKESNTVLVGHRFTYDGAAVFYNLDKLKQGDE